MKEKMILFSKWVEKWRSSSCHKKRKKKKAANNRIETNAIENDMYLIKNNNNRFDDILQ